MIFFINSLIQVSLATFYGFLTGFSCKVGNKHFYLLWGVNRMLWILKKCSIFCFKYIKISLITRFKCNNQNQNSSNDVNNPNDENEDDSFDEDEEIPKINFFHSDVEDMLQVGEITLIKANDPVGSFYLLYMTKEQGVSLK